jgi:hypothetical protein
MDNMYLPPDGGAQDSRATQELGPTGNQNGQAPPGPVPGEAPGGRRGPGRLRRWGIGITAAAVLVLGGGATAVALSGHGQPASSGGSSISTTLSAASSATGSGQHAAAVAKCKKIAAQLRADKHPRAARAVLRACRRGARRLRLVGGIHGTVTYETRKGARTLAFERGVVESVTSSAVVVKAPDGTTWTWDLVSNTAIRHDGTRTTASALSDGEKVFVGGPVVSGSNDARLIVIRPAGAGSASAPGSSTSGASAAS